MSFALLRIELADALFRLGQLSHVETDNPEAHTKQLEEMLEGTKEQLHERYLKYCTPDIDKYPDQWSAIQLSGLVSIFLHSSVFSLLDGLDSSAFMACHPSATPENCCPRSIKPHIA